VKLLEKLPNGIVKYGSNMVWLFIEKSVQLLSGIVVGALVARYLGPAQFGVLNFASALIGMLTIFSYLGLNGIIVRDLVKNEYNEFEILGTTWLFRLIFSILLTIGLAFWIQKYETEEITIILILAVSLLFQPTSVFELYMQSKVQGGYYGKAKLIVLLVIALLKLYLIWSKASLPWFAVALSLEITLYSLGLIYLFRSKLHHSLKKLKVNWGLGISLLKEGWPLLLSGVALSIYLKIDQIMLMTLADDTSVGVYAAASKITNAVNFIPMVIVTTMYPAIVKASEVSPVKYENRLLSLYSLLVWISVIFAFSVHFTADLIIATLYGQDYAVSSQVLKIHVWSSVFVFIGVVYSRHLVTQKKTKTILARNVLGATINIFLNYYLIPIYAEIGAAYATLAGHVFANYIFDLFSKSQIKQFVLKTKAINPFYLVQFLKEK